MKVLAVLHINVTTFTSRGHGLQYNLVRTSHDPSVGPGPPLNPATSVFVLPHPKPQAQLVLTGYRVAMCCPGPSSVFGVAGHGGGASLDLRVWFPEDTCSYPITSHHSLHTQIYTDIHSWIQSPHPGTLNPDQRIAHRGCVCVCGRAHVCQRSPFQKWVEPFQSHSRFVRVA